MLRNTLILNYIKGKKVLDLGFLGENENVDFSPLHKLIQKNSKSVLGVDIDKNRINKLKKKGFNVFCDDVIKLSKLKKTNFQFDIIVAGELIEHLENPSDFVDNLKKFLNPNGIIIFTTPNIYSLRFFIRHTFLGKESPFWINRDLEIRYGHVIGFSKILFENFLLRKGFKIIDFSYVIKNEYCGFKGNLEKLISRLFPRFSPTILYVVKIKK